MKAATYFRYISRTLLLVIGFVFILPSVATATSGVPSSSPRATSITGKRTILPSVEAGDVLPGLLTPAQPDKARFAFIVSSNSPGNIHKASGLQFVYRTGTKCHNPARAENCHHLHLDASTIAWLMVSGENQSEGTFQGTASLTVDGTTTTNRFRVSALDGSRLNPATNDRIILNIFAPGANPDTDYPLYNVTQNILRGNIKLRP